MTMTVTKATLRRRVRRHDRAALTHLRRAANEMKRAIRANRALHTSSKRGAR